MARTNSLPNMAKALQRAIDGEDMAALAKLIESGRPWSAPDDPKPATPLCSTIQREWFEAFDALLASGCPVEERNKHGISPLAMLIDQGQPERAAQLIAAGADLHAVNRLGGDAMHAASRPEGQPSASLTKPLLDANGSSWPHRFDVHGRCALILAASRGRVDMLRLLIDSGMDPDVIGPLGGTPILLAIQNGRSEALSALLQAGAACDDIRQEPDAIPLRLAAKLGRIKCVKTLLAHGADPRLRARDGRTAADEALASPSPHAEAIQELIGGRIALAEAKEPAAQVRNPRKAKKASPRAL